MTPLQEIFDDTSMNMELFNQIKVVQLTELIDRHKLKIRKTLRKEEKFCAIYDGLMEKLDDVGKVDRIFCDMAGVVPEDDEPGNESRAEVPAREEEMKMGHPGLGQAVVPVVGQQQAVVPAVVMGQQQAVLPAVVLGADGGGSRGVPAVNGGIVNGKNVGGA